MIEQLFGSKTRVKLLQLFYSNPNRSFYVREITRKIDEQINSVRRELSNLLSIGIIKSETTNNRLYYEVNQKYELHKPLAQIFGGGSAVSSEDEDLGELVALKPLGHIELALLTGQFTRDEKSGIDFLLVGDINPTQLSKYITELEAKEGKEIRYAVMNRKEFDYRQQINDRFLLTVLDSKVQILVDKINLNSPLENEETIRKKIDKPVKKDSKKE
jgi:hypothetical protein